MKKINIMNESDVAFECWVEGWLERPEDRNEWQQIVTRVVQYAFLSRALTVITISPMPWSIGYSLPKPRRLKKQQDEYLINRINQCSSKLLDEITSSEDFQRGLLCLSDLAEIADEHLNAVDKQITTQFNDQQGTDFELLILLDDSRWIRWLNPRRNPKYLESDIRNIAEILGWSCEY